MNPTLQVHILTTDLEGLFLQIVVQSPSQAWCKEVWSQRLSPKVPART